jgi:hypothetical protein
MLHAMGWIFVFEITFSPNDWGVAGGDGSKV